MSAIDQQRFQSAKSSLFVRGLIFGLLALPTFVFVTIWMALVIPAMQDAKDTMTWLAGLVALVIGGFLPLGIGFVFVWRAVANLREHERLVTLVAALQSGVVRSRDDLGRAMKLPAHRADDALRAAIGRGVVDPAVLFAPSIPPPGVTPQPVSYPPPTPHGPSPYAPPYTPGAANSYAPPSPTQWLHRTIHNTYRVEAPLGHGGMGVVFRARHLPSNTPCALKILIAGRYASADALQRFEREATLARALAHPGVVRVMDVGRAEDGTPFLVMELLEGETLEDRLARVGTLPFREAIAIAAAVGDGLAAAHAAGFLHRDVKPANILLARSADGERPVLIDFGLAKRIDANSTEQRTRAPRVTTTGAVIGTPLYMSPEQARGENLDERSDLYGLAAVVYEMIAGVPPFFDKTLAEVYARLLKEAAPSISVYAPGACPRLVDTVLACALAMRREDRPASVRAFVDGLKAAA
jgi:serine/threonine-protein kinase